MFEKFINWTLTIYLSIACYGAFNLGDGQGVIETFLFAALVSWVDDSLEKEEKSVFL